MSKVSLVAVDEKQALSISKKQTLIMTACLGVMLVFAVGFAPVHAVHNAAHDARHVHAFPCH